MFIKSKKHNPNYLAQIVEITTFTPHPNADKMKLAYVGGYAVCVGINEQPGKYIYFPTNCTINPNILRFGCLYRHGELNANPEKTGFFNDNGRVTAIRLRGVPSEGFLMPISEFQAFIQQEVRLELSDSDFVPGTEFDTFEYKDKSFWVNKKYIIQRNSSNGNRGTDSRNKRLKAFDRVDETQFSFHYDTTNVKKEPWCVNPNDLISITSKWHGTSHISAYVLCYREMTFFRKIANLLQGLPWNSQHRTYDYLYASRSVIKNQYINKGVKPDFYGCDVWEHADKIIKPLLTAGMTVYAEIVGYTPNGGHIQKTSDVYDYGCVPPVENEPYTHNKHFKVVVYRITITNVDGIKHEFSAREVQQWCFKHGLDPVKEYYYGLAKDLYPDLDPVDPNWNTLFWERMSNDKNFYMEMDSPDCVNKVPHEGIVIKVEDMVPRAWKLKSFAFLNGEQKQLDAGESNIEDEN